MKLRSSFSSHMRSFVPVAPKIEAVTMRAMPILVVLIAFALMTPPVAAGNGWYLLKPPLRQGVTDEEILRQFPQWKGLSKEKLHEIAPEVMGDWDAPLSEWVYIGSFDMAAECEKVKIRLMKAALAREPELRLKYPNGYPTMESTFLRESRCIASDDPRLMHR